MIYHLSVWLQDSYHLFNMVHYVSFRAIAALLTAFFFSLMFGSVFIELSKKLFRSEVRPFTPKSHQKKNDTPTLGGLFILLVVLSTIFLWCDWTRPELWLFVLTLTGFGFIGLIDDLGKIWYKRGISARLKSTLQIGVSLVVTMFWLWTKVPSTDICVPFFKDFHPTLGWLIIPWSIFILVGTSNAVNLTDGLDGLAIGSLLTNFSFFSLISFLAGHQLIAGYLHIPFTGVAEASIVGGALVGASLGFLWFNTHPAQIFMGDVGSLSLGAALALMAIIAKQEILLVISGGLFVMETISVILQKLSWKIYGKRIFKMAPIHHHFEMLGWQEPKITVRFNIISLVLCLIALITLKIR